MKEILEGLKNLLGDEVKDIYQYNLEEINIQLKDEQDLDRLYIIVTEHLQEISNPYTLATVNFINYKDEILKSFSLIQ